MNAVELTDRLTRIESSLKLLTDKRKGGRPKGVGEKVNDHVVSRMRALRADGWTISELAEVFGLSTCYVGEKVAGTPTPAEASHSVKALAKVRAKPAPGSGIVDVADLD